jgi:hypothetical protein
MNAAPINMSTFAMEQDCTNNYQQSQEVPMVTAQQREQLNNSFEAIQQAVEYTQSVEQEGGFIIESFLIGTGIVHVLSMLYAVFLAYQCNMQLNFLELAIAAVFPYFYVPYAYYAKQCSSEILIPILIDVFGAIGGILGSFFSSIPALIALVISGFSMYYLRRIDKHLAHPQQMQQNQ